MNHSARFQFAQGGKQSLATGDSCFCLKGRSQRPTVPIGIRVRLEHVENFRRRTTGRACESLAVPKNLRALAAFTRSFVLLPEFFRVRIAVHLVFAFSCRVSESTRRDFFVSEICPLSIIRCNASFPWRYSGFPPFLKRNSCLRAGLTAGFNIRQLFTPPSRFVLKGVSACREIDGRRHH